MALPWWVTVLNAAAEWGQPPWTLTGDDDTLLWLLRWRVYKETVAAAQKELDSTR